MSPNQDDPAQPKPKVLSPGGAGASLQSINDDYNRQLLQLERQRLERLGQLAARQSPKDAAETYEQMFRLAIANNLFREAEPAAKQALKSSSTSPRRPVSWPGRSTSSPRPTEALTTSRWPSCAGCSTRRQNAVDPAKPRPRCSTPPPSSRSAKRITSV